MGYPILKRLIDLFLSVVLGILFLPICLIAAIAIKLESPRGPVFADIPPRVGKNGKQFFTYKFRSMIPNSYAMMRTNPEFAKLFEEYKKSGYKLREDPRVTKVGKFIRKYSIDEIPQFINVLRGEMSVVGPRPYYADELREQEEKYPKTSQSIKDALTVCPGITGQWQVSGRSDINFEKRIELDAHYARNLSLWYDLKILAKTPFAMLSGRGAV